MSAVPVAAILLAAATLAWPPPPRRRLSIPNSPQSNRLAAMLAAPVLSLPAMTATPSVLLVGLIAVYAIVTRIRRQRDRRSRRQEGEAMAAGLDVLVGELRIGAHPQSAFAIAGAESSGAVGRALRAVATRAQLGANVAEGIRAMAADSAVPAYWDRLAVFWQLAAEHGLPMSALIRAAHRDIVDRQRFSDRMHAALAGARATAAILACLPVLGVLLGQLIGAHPVTFLLGGGVGGALLVIGGTLICVGVIWADRIVDRLAA